MIYKNPPAPLVHHGVWETSYLSACLLLGSLRDVEQPAASFLKYGGSCTSWVPCSLPACLFPACCLGRPTKQAGREQGNEAGYPLPSCQAAQLPRNRATQIGASMLTLGAGGMAA